MYLLRLNDKQKVVFLELAYELAFIDNDFSEKEQIMIESYCREMQITAPKVIRTRTVAEVMESLKKGWGEEEKKILLFELVGLAMVDYNYDESERKMIKEMAEFLEINGIFLDQSEKLIGEYINLQGRMNQIVLKQ